jgi:hypothetical protein
MTGQSRPATSGKFHRQPFGNGRRVVTSLHLADIRFVRAAAAIGGAPSTGCRRSVGAVTLSRKTRFLAASPRLKRLIHNPKCTVGSCGGIAMRTKQAKQPELSNESAMSELEYDRLLEAVQMAVAPAPEISLFNPPAKAATDNHPPAPLVRSSEDSTDLGSKKMALAFARAC